MMFVRSQDPYRDLRRSVEQAPQDGPELAILLALGALGLAAAAACVWVAQAAIRQLVGAA